MKKKMFDKSDGDLVSALVDGSLRLLRPGITETVAHTQHTQIEIPWRQSVRVFYLNLGSYLGITAWVVGAWWLITQAGRLGFNGLGTTHLVVGAALYVGFLVFFAGHKARRAFLGRMAREIVEPYSDHPTAEMFEQLANLRSAVTREPEVEYVPVPTPIQVRGGTTKTRSADPVVPRASTYNPNKVYSELDHLVAFVRGAEHRGLARASWVYAKKNQVRLTSGMLMTRGTWEKMLSALEDWGLVEKDQAGAWAWSAGHAHALGTLLEARHEVVNKAVASVARSEKDAETWRRDSLADFADGLQEYQ